MNSILLCAGEKAYFCLCEAIYFRAISTESKGAKARLSGDKHAVAAFLLDDFSHFSKIVQ